MSFRPCRGVVAGALLLYFLTTTGCGGAGVGSAAPSSALDELVAAERAFSGRSVEVGMRVAFLEAMAENVVLFRPGPVRGLHTVRAAPDLDGTLEWSPEVAEVAASGDLGYTTGPYRVVREGAEAGHGHYASVWRQRPDGRWEVILDIGTPHGPVPLADEVAVPPAPRTAVAGSRSALLEADSLLSLRLGESGTGAYRDAALDRLRVHRPGRPPIRGLEEVLAGLSTGETGGPSSALGGEVSGDGSLGFTWGGAAAGEGWGWARVWRWTAEGWRLVLDVATGD